MPFSPNQKNEASGKMRKKHWSLTIFVLGVVLSFETLGQDYFVELAAQRYETASWATEPAKSGIVSNWNPVVPSQFLLNSSVTTNLDYDIDYSFREYVWNSSSDESPLRLRVFSVTSFDVAKKLLLETLGSMTSTIALPQGTNSLPNLGDICLGDASNPDLILFVRNNIFVSAFSSPGNHSVTNILYALDGQITNSLSAPMVEP